MAPLCLYTVIELMVGKGTCRAIFPATIIVIQKAMRTVYNYTKGERMNKTTTRLYQES